MLVFYIVLELGCKRVLGVALKKQLMEGACEKKEREDIQRNRSTLYEKLGVIHWLIKSAEDRKKLSTVIM